MNKKNEKINNFNRKLESRTTICNKNSLDGFKTIPNRAEDIFGALKNMSLKKHLN
jgi:hypothetical protein